MPDLLLELFSEEIPARMQARAAADLERAVNERLLGAGFMPEGVKAFAGPRRLTVVATGLPVRQPDVREEKKGPRVGAPEKAIEGFLKSAGLASLDACERREDKKGDYYVAVIERAGRPTAELVAEFAPEIIRGFSWPKSMRWADRELRWVRPLRRILCTFDGEVAAFEIDGVASGDVTEGHRTMSSGLVQARSFDTYAERLAAARVMLDADARAERIDREARTLCEAQGLELVDDPALLRELAGLAEWPVPMIGAFDERFLSLPDEVLTASMRGHQKYFSVADPKTGRLANRFVCVANIEAKPAPKGDGGKAMRAGYERVLTARLSDARYLYDQDLKRPLESRLADLDGMTFFEGLGTTGEKARRIAEFARELAPAVGADPDAAYRAGLLAKADLTTGMVSEFPELQGVMGRYYALAQGEPAEIADAIGDQYRPAGADGEVPAAPVSIAVGLADRIDTLTAFWSIDKKPTGSSDPFALRRAALGVIALTLGNGVRMDLEGVVTAHFDRVAALHPGTLADELRSASDLLRFFHERLAVHFRDRGARYDHVAAVLADADGELHDDIVLIESRLRALEAFIASKEGEDLVAAFKRAANILKAEAKKGDLPSSADLDDTRLAEDAERRLNTALAHAEVELVAAVAAEDFPRAMVGLASLRAPIDAFFETVTVNADDAALRRNRLAILQRFLAATSRVADLTRLEG